MLCVIFKVRQWGNTAPAVRIAVIIYRSVCLLSATAAIYVQNVIFHFVTTAPTMPSVNCYGERRWTYEADEL